MRFCSEECARIAITQAIASGRLPPPWVSSAAEAGMQGLKIGAAIAIVIFLVFMAWSWFLFFG